MASEVLINVGAAETRVAIVLDGRLSELFLERNVDPNLAPFLLPGGTFGGANASQPALYDFIGRRFFLIAQMKF